MIIDNDIRQRLQEIKTYAEKNPYSMDDLFDIMNKDILPPGDELRYSCIIPIGIKIVFSFELQKYKVRHLSMSGPRGAPHPAIVKEIMKELGFAQPLEKCMVKMEHENRIVNIWEKIL